MDKIIDSGILAMPAPLRTFAITNVKSASPYNGYLSGSYYTQECKSWDYTPPDTIRISDHWNFYSRGELHCQTIQPVENGYWSVGRYNPALDKYDIYQTYDKDYTEIKKREERQLAKQFIDNLIQASRIRTAKAREISWAKKAAQRVIDIKNGNIHVSFNHRVWKKGGKGHYNLVGEEMIQGILTWESKGGAWIVVNGIQYRQMTNYKETNTK